MGRFAVITKEGRQFVIGAFAVNPWGVRFVPFNQHSPSRKNWPDERSALPRWARDAEIIEAPSFKDAVATINAAN